MSPDDARAVGARIRSLRQAKDWTISDLARRAGTARSTMSRIECGQRNTPTSTLIAIAKVFGVSTDYLLGLETRNGQPAYHVGMLLDVVSTDGRVLHQTRVLRMCGSFLVTEDTVLGQPGRNKRYSLDGVPWGGAGARIRPAQKERAA